MIYCEKRKDYVEQEEVCLLCIFYTIDIDSCWYGDWYPGLIKENKDKHVD
jgi:hypothetical protein